MSREAVDVARRELDAIDGSFGLVAESPSVLLVSNDLGWKEYGIHKLLGYHRESRPGGIGLSIGSGNMLSLLPQLDLDLFVVIDANTSLVHATRALQGLIKRNKNSVQAMLSFEELEDGRVDGVIHQNRMSSYYGRGYLIREALALERKNFGSMHWTDPRGYKMVAKSVSEKPISCIAGNVMNSGFVEAIHAMVDYTGLEVSYVNMTNIHQWVGDRAASMCISGLGLRDDAIVVASDHNHGEWGDMVRKKQSLKPSVKIMRGIQEYINFVENSHCPGIYTGDDLKDHEILEKPWRTTLPLGEVAARGVVGLAE